MQANVIIQSIRKVVTSRTITSCACLLISVTCFAESMLLTYRSPVGEADDKRYRYELEVLRLALEKTKSEYGDFELVPSGPMNNLRAIEILRKKSMKNFILKLSYDSDFPDFMDYIRFPVDLGIGGYRVCFISPKAKERLSASPTLEELTRFSHLQGRGWMDAKILRGNGFIVDEVSNYTGKFHAIANNHHDLFCRGIDEFREEYEKFSLIEGLDFDRTFALAYPLPRFFYTHIDNQKVIERVSKGIMLAYEDGSLVALWMKTHSNSIKFSAIWQRKVIKLENPAVQGIDFDYQQFFYDLSKTY